MKPLADDVPARFGIIKVGKHREQRFRVGWIYFNDIPKGNDMTFVNIVLQ